MATSISDILRHLRITIVSDGHRHSRPGWIQIDCPWCGPNTHKFHLGYNLALNYWNCWRCGGKSTYSVLTKLGLAREEVRKLLSTLHPEIAQKRERQRVSLKEPAGVGELQSAHRRYLEDRGYRPDELIRLWEIGGIGLHPRLAWRIYIPIIENGIRVSWTTRAIGKRVKQRYLSASADEESVNHKEVVYGLDYCRSVVVICEGPFDAWKIGPGAVCTFGTAFSTAQVRKLIRIPYRYVCFDSSSDAQRVAKRLCRELSVFPGETNNVVIGAKDPGELSENDIRKFKTEIGI